MLARGRMSPDCLEACDIMWHHVACAREIGESLGDTWQSRVPKNPMAQNRFLIAFGDFQWFESFFYRHSISIAVLSQVSSPIRHRLCALPRVLHALWCWSPWSASRGSGMPLPWCHAPWSLCALVDQMSPAVLSSAFLVRDVCYSKILLQGIPLLEISDS